MAYRILIATALAAALSLPTSVSLAYDEALIDDQDPTEEIREESPNERPETSTPLKLTTESETELNQAISSAERLKQSSDFETLEKNEQQASQDLAELLLQPSLNILGAEVQPGTAEVVNWRFETTFTDISVPVPVLVVNGTKSGPTLCLTAAVHGDELNGIEIVRRIIHETNPNKLTGAIIGVPIVNLQGFQRASRYLPDRRDLNRYFPGREHGSYASRVAFTFFNQVVRNCDFLVDLHTGSLSRTNLPQIRANLSDPVIASLAEKMGSIVVLQSRGGIGTLRRAASDAGIPAVTLEAGAPNNLQKDAVEEGVKTIKSALSSLGMSDKPFWKRSAEPVFYRSKWIRAGTGGILFSKVELGDNIEPNQTLGLLSDPITNKTTTIKSPIAGRVIGMALNQVMYPGFAAYHVGLKSSMVEAAQKDELLERDLDDPDNDTAGNVLEKLEIVTEVSETKEAASIETSSELIETTSTPIEEMELPTAESD